MREKIFIFDKFDNLLATTNKYIKAEFEETVEKPVSLTIEFPMSDEKAEYLIGGNQVAFRDLRGNFRLFAVREVDDQDGEATEKVVHCMPGMQELTDVMVEERRPQDKTAEYVLGLILEKSRWQVGKVAELGANSTSFYFKSAYECLGELTKLWGGEIVDRIEIKDNKIAGRYIDIVERKGSDTGKRFEIDKDIKNIKRTVLYYPKTALYGKGSSLEVTDDDGEETGGYTRKITFRDVEWKKSKGDPVDKPKGQEWVGDPEALEKHGIPNHKTGKMMHRFGMFEDNDEEDPESLLEKTWQAVQDEKDPKAQYEMSIMTFYGIAGYEHEQVFLGDTGIARDKSIKPMILIESRIMSWKYDIGDPSNGELILGNILDLDPDNSKIDWVIEKVENNAGNWDAGGGPITDDKFPDVKPKVPTNFTAEGLFKTVMLSWDFESTYAIAAYEVYASQINGFTPDPTNLVYRGKTGGYNFQADTDQKWYFRVRAVNTHGTASEYSEQVSASTVQLDLPDLVDIVPDFIEYSIYEGEEAPDPKQYKFWVNTGEKPFLLYQWSEVQKDWIALAPTNPEDVGAVGEDEYNQKISEIEKTDDEIKLNVKDLKTTVGDQGVKINNNQSLLKQHATEIMSRVTQKTYETDMESMTTRVSIAESEIRQNAKEITLRVSKNGVVSSINQSPEEIKINAERVSIDGDLLVKNGKVYIKDGIITNSMIAGDAKIDFAKIGNVKITNAMIDSINASKIAAGILDANKVIVQVKNGTQAIKIDDKGFQSVDSSGNVRIHIGVRNISGKGQSDPATIRFFAGSGNVAAGVGMNVNDTFVIGSQNKNVAMELYSGKNTIMYGAQIRFKPHGTSDGEYARFASVPNTGGTAREVTLQPNASGHGYIGTSGYRWWRVYTNHIHWVYKHESSTRKDKTNIQELDTRYLQSIFDKVTLKSFNRIIDTGGKRKVDTDILSFGQIAEESPDEITDPGKESINEGNYIAVIAGSLKYQTNRVDLHDNEIVSLKNKVASLENEVKALREEK